MENVQTESECVLLHGSETDLRINLTHYKRSGDLLSSSIDSTGLLRWGGGMLLAQLLYSTGILSEKLVVELGCGSALLSCVASMSGCSRLIATDGFPKAVSLAEHNLRKNGCCSKSFDVCQLRWGEASDESRVLQFLSPDPHFDVALASEVFYYHKGGSEEMVDQGTALFSTALRLLAVGGVLLIAYSPRYPGMARALREAGSRAGAFIRTINRGAFLTKELAEVYCCNDTRLLMVAHSSEAIQHWVKKLGSPSQASRCDDSDFDNDPDWVEKEAREGWDASSFSVYE